MEAADGWLVRVRPKSGRIDPTQLEGLATIAQTYGNGLMHLSSRGNFQLRGLSQAHHRQVLAKLKALNLLDPNPHLEARRNILLSPFEDRIGAALAEELNAHLIHLPALPPKFGFSVDTGTYRYLAAASADVRVERSHSGALMVRADGAPTGLIVSPKTVVEAIHDLCLWFLESGGRSSAGGKRMRQHLASGATLPSRLAGKAEPSPLGSLPDAGPITDGWIIGVSWGQTSATVMHTLARLDGLKHIYMTPWRKMVIKGPVHRAKTWTALITNPDIIHQPHDPRTQIAACIGAPYCAEGFQDTRNLALQLVPLLKAKSPTPTVHISGCNKGCAAPASPSTITLVGTEHGFDWIENGRAHDLPLRTQIDPLEATLAYLDK
ncbi:MAG: precorrin-3B synthase [Myxococcales bacterium]|nr:precorrin-3B synthase [Myxococcales bacterium]